jgi:hypothetical protein
LQPAAGWTLPTTNQLRRVAAGIFATEPRCASAVTREHLACCGSLPSKRTAAREIEESRTMSTIIIIILILLLIGALPTWPYSAGWGYYPTGGLGTVLIILVVLMLLGRI